MGKHNKAFLFCITVANGLCCKSKKIKQCDTLEFRSNTLQLGISSNCGKKIIDINTVPANISTSQFYSLGAQVVQAGQPFSIPSAVFNSPNVSPLPLNLGTVFNVKKAGKYQVSYNTFYTDNAAILLYGGINSASLQPLYYTLSVHSNSVIVQVPNNNYFLSLYASPTNVTDINIPSEISPGSQNVSNISFTWLSC